MSLNRLARCEQVCREEAISARDEATRSELIKLAEAFRQRQDEIQMTSTQIAGR